MQPNHCDLLGQVREPRAASQLMRDGQPREQGQPRLSGAAPMRSEDSWIEVASQPSSSSLSSAAASDDIITTGLRVEQQEAGVFQRHSRRRRLQHLAAVTAAQVDYASREASSSQEEYEESESDPDPNMSSSNEDVRYAPIPRSVPLPDDADSDEEDDTSTALGMGINTSPFVPQPNVFSHPPATSDPSWTRPNESRRSQPNLVSGSSRRATARRESYPNTRSSRRSPQSNHSPYNMISPSHHADHDAALRASLSTLLSCAAAARGLQKPEPPRAQQPGPSTNPQPASFRLVGESVAMGDETSDENLSSPRYTDTSPPTDLPHRQQARSAAPPSKGKRRSPSPKDRNAAAKKTRHATLEETPPTVMTWVISAGVVVLFSAISFSAGYMLGREVGRTEMSLMGDGSVPSARSSAACGQEAVRGGLKRLRWGTGAGSVSFASM